MLKEVAVCECACVFASGHFSASHCLERFWLVLCQINLLPNASFPRESRVVCSTIDEKLRADLPL